MAVTKKSSSRPASEKTKKVSLDFSSFQKNLKRHYDRSPVLFVTIAIILVVVAALLALFFTNKGLFLAGSVDGKLITTPQFYSKLKKSNGPEVFDSLVREILIKQEASKKGAAASDSEINKKIKELEDRFGGKDMLQRALSQNNTSLPELKEQITIQILVEKLLKDKITVSDQEVEKYSNENKESVTGLSKDQIKDQVRSQKLNQEFSQWYEALKSKAKITKYF